MTVIIFRHKPPIRYVVDEIAEEYGHKVLRLPPYHCVFNPIELVWGITKTYYNKHVGKDGYSVDKCLELWKRALAIATPQIWANCIRKTNSIINEWYEREQLMDQEDIAPLIIDINEDDSSDEEYLDESD